MDYKTIFIVAVLLGLPTIVLVIAKLISKLRQAWGEAVDTDKDGLDRDPGEVTFGDGESGKSPSSSNDEMQGSNEHGAGESQPDESGPTTIEMYEYLEKAVLCGEPTGKESFEKLTDKDDSSDVTDAITEQKS